MKKLNDPDEIRPSDRTIQRCGAKVRAYIKALEQDINAMHGHGLFERCRHCGNLNHAHYCCQRCGSANP